MKKLLGALAFTLLLSLLLLGCSNSPNSTTSNEVHEEAEASDATEDTNLETEEDETDDSEIGVIMTQNRQGGSDLILKRIDPNTGAIADYKRFPIGNSYDNIYSLGISPIYSTDSPFTIKQAFSSDYSKIAVQFRVSDTGNDHVGYLTDEGELFDISANITEQSNSFSAEAVSHSYPVISDDGYFFFMDGRSIKRVPLDNLDQSAVETVRSWNSNSTVRSYFLSGDNSLVTKEQLSHNYSQGGGERYSGYKVQSPSGGNFALFIDQTWTPNVITRVMFPANNSSLSIDENQRFIDWIDDENFLTSSFGIFKSFKEPVGDWSELLEDTAWVQSEGDKYGGYTNTDYTFYQARYRYLLPESNRINRSPVASPDGSKVFFLSRIEGTSTISFFEVGTDGISEPVEIAQMNPNDIPASTSLELLDGMMLIDWR